MPRLLLVCFASTMILLASCQKQQMPANMTAPPPPPAACNICGTVDFDREQYAHIDENDYKLTANSPLSTFSVDVDTASYANVRRFLRDGQLPPPDAVRIEELINYFAYEYPVPTGDDPVAIHAQAAECPWNSEHRLAHIGLRARSIDMSEAPPSNLVFLLDVSGSMKVANKLPWLKKAFRGLVEAMRPEDRVAIVVYAGAAGLVLPSTPASERAEILAAIEQLAAGGSTAGGAGIQLAYKTAREGFVEGGNNRVILATDGDFNVGASSDGAMVRLIEKERQSGVFLTVLGFGSGNIQDSKMEALADHGNGNHAYIDSSLEARRVLVEQMGATLHTVAKDVKLQVEFNPAHVAGYRLIGYENRLLGDRDFNDDSKDAGDMGAGHTVTALYELVPAGQPVPGADVDPLKYSQAEHPSDPPDWLTVKMRYKAADGDTSVVLAKALEPGDLDFAAADEDLRFATAVAAFGMTLRGSEHRGETTYEMAGEIARGAVGADPDGRRAEFYSLVRVAERLAAPPSASYD